MKNQYLYFYNDIRFLVLFAKKLEKLRTSTPWECKCQIARYSVEQLR